MIRKYKVGKGYCGIEKGTILERDDSKSRTIVMLKKGYYTEYNPIEKAKRQIGGLKNVVKAKIEKGLDYIQNKIEPGVKKRKTK